MIKRENAALTSEQIELVSTVVQGIIAPVMDQIGMILERNSQAMERIAATQQMMSTRISDLEKQVRLKTPMSKAQEKCVNDAIRARARELLDRMGFGDDKKAVSKLGGVIRKSVLVRYGIDSLREAPAYDYDTAIQQVKGWNDILVVRNVAKEARKRAEMDMAEAQQPPGVDGAVPDQRPDDQQRGAGVRHADKGA